MLIDAPPHIGQTVTSVLVILLFHDVPTYVVANIFRHTLRRWILGLYQKLWTNFKAGSKAFTSTLSIVQEGIRLSAFWAVIRTNSTTRDCRKILWSGIRVDTTQIVALQVMRSDILPKAHREMGSKWHLNSLVGMIVTRNQSTNL